MKAVSEILKGKRGTSVMKKVRKAFLALIVVFVLAGCLDNQSSKRAEQTEKDSNEKIVLRFATWDSGEALKIQEAIAKKFEEKHPFIKVQMEAYGDEFDQKLAVAFGAKSPPDIMYMWNFPAYFHSLEPLEKFINRDPNVDLNDFYQGLFNYSTMYRKLYGMPAGFTTRVVYYNKDLFDAADIPYPKDGWTWDDFKSVAKKLSNPAMGQYGFGVRPEPDTYDLQGIVWSNGSSFISEDGKKIDSYMNSPETIESIRNVCRHGQGKKRSACWR